MITTYASAVGFANIRLQLKEAGPASTCIWRLNIILLGVEAKSRANLEKGIHVQSNMESIEQEFH